MELLIFAYDTCTMTYLWLFIYVLFTVCVYKLFRWILTLPRIGSTSDRYVLITGCDYGFGNLLAKKLDKMDCRVFASCLRKDSADKLNEETSDRVTTLEMDVSSPQSIRRALGLIQYWLPEGKGLWSIVNNAGILGRPGFIDWLNVDDYKHVADVNLFGLIDVTNVFLPLVKKERGRVILMSSFLGRLSLPCSTPYAVTKYGVEAFADGLRFSMAPFGVSVHVLEPGFHKTNIGDTSVIKSNIKDSWERCSDDIRKQYGDSFIDKMTKVLDGPGALLVAHPKHVVNAYKHAIFGLFPKTRYVVGLDANILGVPLPYLPGAISDMLLALFIPLPNFNG